SATASSQPAPARVSEFPVVVEVPPRFASEFRTSELAPLATSPVRGPIRAVPRIRHAAGRVIVPLQSHGLGPPRRRFEHAAQPTKDQVHFALESLLRSARQRSILSRSVSLPFRQAAPEPGSVPLQARAPSWCV